jgi:hypothetical protein
LKKSEKKRDLWDANKCTNTQIVALSEGVKRMGEGSLLIKQCLHNVPPPSTTIKK